MTHAVGRPKRDDAGASGLGRAIASAREAAGLTRPALAARAGLSLNTLMKVEQGRTLDPGVFKVAAVCDALAIPADDVVRSSLNSHRKEQVMTHGIVSAGYEGRSIEEMVEALVRMGVSTVADVRLNPISRKPGFSKNRLRDALAAVGIEYRHLRSLGNAKENREPFWTGRVEEGRDTFRRAIQNPDAEQSLSDLADLAADQVVAVLCFEANQDACHRHVVIEEVTNNRSLPVEPLSV